MNTWKRLLLVSSLIFFSITCAHKLTEPPIGATIFAENQRPRNDHVEALGARFAIATQGKYSTEAARKILAQGGNLIDAAVASSFVLAVERPHSTGITGGGFMLYREAKSGKIYAIDFRERAPLAATKNMFVGADGKADLTLSQDSILASGVPGLVAGLSEIHRRFGKLKFQEVVQPAMDLAENGFPVYGPLARALESRSKLVLAQKDGRAIFAKDGQVLKENEMLIQKDLGKTLRVIAQKGRDGFYKGPIANKFLEFFKKHKGLITAKDFAAYKVKWREPVRGTFHGYEIYSMPPPSSGGVHVIQFLNFLEKDDLAQMKFLSAPAIHIAASALQSAFSDRAEYLGDTDFVKVPVMGLTSKAYSQERRQEVNMEKTRPAADVHFGKPRPYESSETTHFSMIDAEGNMVSSTQTINGLMGSGLIVPGTGMVLNNEMDDFSAQPGVANMYGALGGTRNAIQAQKTPLSSMSPTLVLKDQGPVLAVGAPGGTRIISCVAQAVLNYLEFKLPLYESVASIRYHHQWRPDVLQIDPPGPSPLVLAELKNKGYNIELKHVGCNVMAASSEASPAGPSRVLKAVSDPRDIGWAAAE